ncbi:3-oxoacyl-[acyl-carrier-protein] reductase FabG [Biomphalaria glabrata]|uniref:3-oxoacyl-[acyl-carrier-protein] reductase FabG-like n=1 Tax=Biomphalaria glabrata TaxID=6526 RepID=A0A9U8EI63_BIOGL|nr:3-oxoacyl-[acyl-carrier-protein] reductase FabG-like [Biomphalaria glabrata]KAI8765649.1 3-oxoacyl-[acyl-carrier-protein] reductase FabG-like [Biomphalaria glabrata]
MSKDFKDKVVVITGASSGIGECTAILFAQHGANVVLCGRDEQKLSSALQKCQEKSGGNVDKHLAVQGDITDSQVRRRIVQQTMDKFGHLDVLVSNAGIITKNISLEDAIEEAFDLTISTNVKAGFFLIQEAIPHLEKSQGCIVVVSSITSTVAVPYEIIYGMSKAAVDYMTKTYALGLAPKGIRVNAINPTAVSFTRFERYYCDEEESRVSYLKYASQQPLYRRNSTPEEQAQTILFLASSAASFITGQCVNVDGGCSLAGPQVDY